MASLAKLFPVADAEKVAIIGRFEKTAENVNEDLKILTEWLKKQPHIPEIKDDSLLEHILIRNKFRIEKAKLKIDSYFTSKNVYADYFDTLDPGTEAMVKSAKYTYSFYMPKLTPDNKRVHIWIMDPLIKLENYDFKSIVRYGSILTETQMIYDYCPEIITISDAISFKMVHIFHSDLALQAKMLKIFFEAFSGQLSTIHMVNVSSAAEKFIQLMKPMLPEKLRNRIHFHSTLESLHKIIPKEYLPLEFGGTERSGVEISDELAATLRKERNNILTRNKMATDESLRIGEPPIEMNMFGMDGTFKKLTLD